MKTFCLISFLFAATALAEEPDGIPNVVPNSFTPTNVCYTDAADMVVCEIFNAPNTETDFGLTQMLNVSPRDASRIFSNLPSFGLAKWHWWLLSQAIFHAQRQYADCVGSIREHNILLREPLFDDADSPFTPVINSIREYEVPFEAIQNVDDLTKPPRKEDAINHVVAALATYNGDVANLEACRIYLVGKRAITVKKMATATAKIKSLTAQVKALKRRLR